MAMGQYLYSTILGAWIFIYQQKNVHQAPEFWPIPIEKKPEIQMHWKKALPNFANAKVLSTAVSRYSR